MPLENIRARLERSRSARLRSPLASFAVSLVPRGLSDSVNSVLLCFLTPLASRALCQQRGPLVVLLSTRRSTNYGLNNKPGNQFTRFRGMVFTCRFLELGWSYCESFFTNITHYKQTMQSGSCLEIVLTKKGPIASFSQHCSVLRGLVETLKFSSVAYLHVLVSCV